MVEERVERRIVGEEGAVDWVVDVIGSVGGVSWYGFGGFFWDLMGFTRQKKGGKGGGGVGIGDKATHDR